MSLRITTLAIMMASFLFGFITVVPAAAGTTEKIDPATEGSITIHKLVGPTAEESSSAPRLADRTPLDGIEFSVQRVEGIDLTNSADWSVADGLTVQQVLDDPREYPLGASMRRLTGNDGPGIAQFQRLKLGVYIVSETNAGSHEIEKPIEPFLVSIPSAHDESWTYDVHAYPKNWVWSESPPIPTATENSDAPASNVGLGKTRSDLATTGTGRVVVGLLLALCAIVAGLVLIRMKTGK